MGCKHKLALCGCGVCPRCSLSGQVAEICSAGRMHDGTYNARNEKKPSKKRKKATSTTATATTSSTSASTVVSCNHKIALCGCGVCPRCFLSGEVPEICSSGHNHDGTFAQLSSETVSDRETIMRVAKATDTVIGAYAETCVNDEQPALPKRTLSDAFTDQVNAWTSDLTARKSTYSASQLNTRNEKQIRGFAKHATEAFVSSIADEGDVASEARVLRILRDAVCTADPLPPGDGMGGVLQTLADVATNSTEFHSRHTALQVLADHVSYDALHKLMVDSELRLVDDPARMDVLRSRDARDLPAHHLRLLKVDANNQPEPIIRGVSSTLRSTLIDELDRITRNLDTPARRKRYKSRVSPAQVAATLEAIEGMCDGGWSHQTQASKLTGERSTYLWRSVTDQDFWVKYCTLVDEDGTVNGEESVGRPVFTSLLQATTKRMKASTGVSYYLGAVMSAIDAIKEMVERIPGMVVDLVEEELLPNADGFVFDSGDIDNRMRLLQDAVRDGFYSHACNTVDSCDGIAMHCTGLGMGVCKKEHSLNCDKCVPAFVTLPFIAEKLEELKMLVHAHAGDNVSSAHGDSKRTTYDEVKSMISSLGLATLEIETFHQHTLRGRWQQESIGRRYEGLKEGQMVLVMDYMMKVLPRKHDETPKDFYGKSGMSVLGAHLTFMLDGVVYSIYVDMISDSDGVQDVQGSLSLMDALYDHILKTYPGINEIIVVSDNGSHFSSHGMLYAAFRFNLAMREAGKKLRIIEYLFCEPQWGKSRLDTHFAFLKIVILLYLDAKHDVTTVAELFLAMTRGLFGGKGCVANTTIALVVPVKPKIPQTDMHSARKELAKFIGIRSVASCIFTDEGMVLSQLADIPGTAVNLTSGDKNAAQWHTSLTTGIVAAEGYYKPTDTTFLYDDMHTQTAPLVPAREKSIRKTRVRIQSALEEVMKKEVLAFNTSHTVKEAAIEAARPSAAVQLKEVENAREFSHLVAGRKKSKTKEGGKKKKRKKEEESKTKEGGKKKKRKKEGEKEEEVVPSLVTMPGAARMFGLKSGFAKRVNKKKMVYPPKIEERAKQLYDYGETHNRKKSAARVREELLLLMGNDWRTRFMVSESVVKGWFSTWTTEKKKKKAALLKAHKAEVAKSALATKLSVASASASALEPVPVSTSASVPVSAADVSVSMSAFADSAVLVEENSEDEENANVRIALERAAMNNTMVEEFVVAIDQVVDEDQ